MSKVIISRILPHLAALDNENPSIEMIQDQEFSLYGRSEFMNLRYEVTYTFNLSQSDFAKAFEE